MWSRQQEGEQRRSETRLPLLKTDPSDLRCTLLYLPRATRALGSSWGPRGPTPLPAFCLFLQDPQTLSTLVGWLRERRLTLLHALCLLRVEHFSLWEALLLFVFFLLPLVDKAPAFYASLRKRNIIFSCLVKVAETVEPRNGALETKCQQLWRFWCTNLQRETPAAPLLKYQLPRGFH